MARILGSGGQPLGQASVASIFYVVTNLATGAQSAAVPLIVSGVVYNDLQQTDPRWTRDSADYPGPDGRWGYNVAFTLPASALPVSVPTPGVTTPATRFQVDVEFIPVQGEPFRVSWSLAPVPVFA
jgi:hypothetical protein